MPGWAKEGMCDNVRDNAHEIGYALAALDLRNTYPHPPTSPLAPTPPHPPTNTQRPTAETGLQARQLVSPPAFQRGHGRGLPRLLRVGRRRLLRKGAIQAAGQLRAAVP
eukprot:1159470-Pelagomonas_calceolata.AAC.2